ncbi:Ig-like domain-containing protein, partial [Verminephrobacter aporrectodeae]|uniref:Ig-like domain-containing protein n=9 Tax=Verminephrobacter aporrectodeae TaxID=1110389 RepID=UPI0022449C55
MNTDSHTSPSLRSGETTNTGGTPRPTLAATNPITIADNKLSLGESTTVTIRFAEAIATNSFTTADLTVGGSAKLSNLRSTDGGTTWTVTLTAPGQEDLQPPLFDSSRYNSTGNQISVNLAGVTNPAGNAGVGQAVSTVTYDIDVWAPSATITLGDSALTAGETTTVTISFVEPVTGFTAANIDLSRTSGTLGPLTALGDGRTWTVTFTPAANTNAAANSIGVRGITDLAGNTSNVFFSDNYSIDTRPGSTNQTSDLSARVTLADSRLTTGEKATVIIAFNKPVTSSSFTIDDVDMTHANGTLSDLTLSADSRTWTATFTPTANVIAESNTISVNLAGVTDAAGTAGTGSATSGNFIVNTAPIAATITLADTALTAGETTTVTFSFNQAVMGFMMDDIDLTQANGTLSELVYTSNSGNKTWTTTFTPKADVSGATNTIRVNLTGVANMAGRSGTGTADSANYTVDTRPPDTTPPEFNSATVNGNQLVLTYTEANTLDAAALAGSAGFTVSSTTGTAITVSSAVVHATDKTVTLTLSRAVTPAETVKVSYTKPASGAVVQDAAGNDAVSFSEQAVTNNSPPAAGGTRLPTLAATNPITIADNKLSVGESTTVTIRFAEAIATDSFTTDDLRVGGSATLSNLRSTDGGTTWTVTLTAPGRSVLNDLSFSRYNSTGNQISVDLTGVTNPAGNAGVGQAVSTVTYDIDVFSPGVSITLGDNALTAGETTTVTFSFSEPVNGFTAANIDLSQAHGALGPLTALGDGRSWTATFTPTADTNTATNRIRVNYHGVTDLAGNTANSTSPSDNYSIDTRPGSTNQPSDLSARVTLTNSPLMTGEKAIVIVAFNKPVNGFTLDDVDMTGANGTLSDLALSADGRTWTATFTPTAGVNDATNTIRVNLAGVTYGAGTAGTGSATSDNFRVDTALPAATITLADTALTVGETTTVTFAFNQSANGFTMDDIDLTQANGTLSALTTADGKTWTATLTPTANVNNASNTIRVNQAGVTNDAGRSGTGTASSANYTVDTRPQDATAPVINSAMVNGNQLVLTYTEANTLDPAALAGSAGFTVSSTTGTAITVSGAVVHATDKTVTLTLSRAVTPAETVKVSYTKPASGAVVQDAAGNDAVSFSEQAVTNTSPPAAGGTRLPTLAATNPITIADDKLSVGESTTVTIRFAEAIATDSFTTDDLRVSGYATLSNLRSTDGGTTWTVTLTAPTARDIWETGYYNPGKYSSTGNQISVNLTGVTNPAGNAGVGQAVSTVTYDIDAIAPTVAITLGDSALTTGETTTVTISFNEPVTGFDADDIDLTQAHGTLGPLTALTDGRTWTATFTPTANTNVAENKIIVKLDGVTDLAGNKASANVISTSSNYSINTQPGSTDQTTGLSASVTLTDSRLTTGEKATVIIAFNKPVNDFTLDDVDGTRAHGTLSDLTRSADGRTWTATFTPTANVIAETNTISVNLAGVTYAAGTASTAGTGRTTSDNFIVHTALPAATITLADTALTAGETTTVTFRFNQVVFGFTMDDIVLDTATGTLGALTTTDNQTWTATLTPKADVSGATNTIRVNLTGVANVAGRSGTGTADSANYTVDTRLPDATPPAFSSAAVNGSQLVLTYTEAGTLDPAALAGSAGFTVSSTTGTAITVSGAVVHATNKTVTLTLSRAVTPAETVKVSYTKPASGAVVQDAAGNDAVNFSEQAVTNNSPPAGGGTQLPTLAATNPITIADDKLSIGESTTVTIRFAEAIATDSFTIADLSVGGSATLANDLRSTDGGITWTVTLKAPGRADMPGGDITRYNSTGNQIRVNLTGVTNLAGNAGVGQAVSTVTYDIDVFSPGVSITLGDNALTAGETTTVTFSFSEPVNGFTAANIDLSQAHGALGPLTALGDGRSWTATFTPTANTSATTNRIRVNYHGVTDLAGNTANGTSPSDNYSIDTRPGSTNQPSDLSARVTLTNSPLMTGEKAAVIIAFNKPVNSFTIDDVDGTRASGTLSDLACSADGRTWTATFTPTANVIDETNTISVNLAGVTDAAGTAGTGSVTSDNFIVHTALPAATITLADTALTTGETTTVTFTFNQDVTDFTLNDIDLTQANGTLSALVYIPDTGNKTWTATFTPKANFSNASNTISVNLAGVTNMAGRSGTGTAISENYTVDTRTDTTPPAFSSAAVNGSQLVLTYTEANTLDPAALAGSAGFTVSSTTGTAITVSGAVVHATNKTVTLTLSRAVTQAETVKVSYTKPASGAVVQDAAGNDAVSFSEQAVTNNTPAATDTTPPAFSSAAVNGSQLVITYTEANTLDAAALAGSAGFTVSSSTGTAITVSSAVVNGADKTVTLTLSRAVTQAETVKVNYTKPASGAVVQDAAGNDAVSFSDQAVTNNTPATPAAPTDNTAPVFNSAAVNGDQLVITYTEANTLDPAALAGNAGFTVSSTTGAAITVSGAVVNATAKTVTLTLSRAVTPAETVKVNYTKPASGAVVQDAAGNDAVSFSEQAVTNNTPAAPAAPTDNTAPVFNSAAVNGDQLVISYTEANTLDAAALAGNAGFTVSSSTGTAITVSSAVVHATNKTVTLTLSRAVTPTETVKVNYTKPASGAVVQDAAGNDAVSFSDQAVTNNTPATPAAPTDTTPPVFNSAAVNGSQLVITYTEANTLDPAALAGNAGFTVSSTTGTAITVSGAVVHATNKTVTLTLSRAVTQAETVKVNYTKPASGAVVQDAAGNDAVSFSDQAVTNNTPATPAAPTDNTAPVFNSAAVNGDQLVITYTEANTLDPAALAGNAGFTVSSSTGTAITVSGAVVHATNKTVTLTLSRAVTPTETVKVNYTKPASGAVVQDAAGNDAVSFSDQAVTNNTPAAPAAPEDTTPPAFSSAAVNGTQLVLTYTEANTLDAAALAGNAGFTVSSTTGTAITVSGAVVHATNKTVTLTLSRAVTPAETVKVSYTKPASGAVVQDAAGNDAVSFSEQAVTNTSPPAGGGTQRPTLAATNPITIADDKLSIGESTTVTIRFAEAIATDSFTIADLTVGGYATLANDLRSTDGGITWTVTLKAPTMQDLFAPEGFGSGKYNSTGNQIRVNLAGVTNLAGNAGVGQAVSTVTYDIDTIAPGVTIRLGDTSLTPGETTTVTFSFNEPVTGFNADNIDLTRANGTLGPLTAIGDDRRTWTATFTPAANVNDAENKIRVRSDGVADLAGNGTSTSVSSNYTIDTRPGTTGQTSGLSASVTLTDDRLTTGEKAIVIIAFNKPVNGFTLDDVDATHANGTLSDLILSADGRTWTATFTPTAGVIAESNTISVNLAGVTDAAGTAATGSATSDNFIVNTALPAATITLTDTALTAGETTTVTFTFNQVVIGFTIDDIDLTQANGTLSALTYAANKTWTATFTPDANVSAATNTIRVNLTGVANVAGRSSTGTASSANYTVDTRVPDTTAPQLITTGATSPKVTGDQLVLSFNDTSNLDADPDHKPANGAFTVLVNGVANTVTHVTVQAQAKTVTLTLSTAVSHGQTVTVAYTDPTTGNDTNAIQNAAGHDVASFAATGVVNNTPAATDTTPPVFSSAAVNGDQLVITYTEANTLDAAALAGNAGFTVSSSTGTAITVSSAVVNATAK